MQINTAVDYLKKFYANSSKDKVTLKEIYASANPELKTDKQKRTWVGNKLIYMKRFDLLTPIYEGRALESVVLTDEGKRMLGRFEKVTGGNGKVSQFTSNRAVSIEQIMEAVPKLREKNPDFDIEFSVKQKKDSGVSP